MILEKYTVLGYFHAFNEEYFDGVLPIPNIKITKAYKYVGRFSCQVNSNNEYCNFLIEMTNNFDYTFEQVRDVLVHEMIHFYLVYVGEDPKCTHGKKFKKMAKKFNDEYGMNIDTRININDYILRKGRSKLLLKFWCYF